MRETSWKSYEAADKPQLLPSARNARKLKGKAISQWVHLRNFPLIVEKFVIDKDEEVLALALKLHEVTERATASEFHVYEIDLLEDCVIEYLNLRKKLRQEYPDFFNRPKPKHHFFRLVPAFVLTTILLVKSTHQMKTLNLLWF